MPRMMEAEMGGCTCKPKIAKDCQPLPEARKESWDRYPLGFSGRDQPKPHLDFGFLASSPGTESISVVLSTPLIVICHNNLGK